MRRSFGGTHFHLLNSGIRPEYGEFDWIHLAESVELQFLKMNYSGEVPETKRGSRSTKTTRREQFAWFNGVAFFTV